MTSFGRKLFGGRGAPSPGPSDQQAPPSPYAASPDGGGPGSASIGVVVTATPLAAVAPTPVGSADSAAVGARAAEGAAGNGIEFHVAPTPATVDVFLAEAVAVGRVTVETPATHFEASLTGASNPDDLTEPTSDNTPGPGGFPRRSRPFVPKPLPGRPRALGLHSTFGLASVIDLSNPDGTARLSGDCRSVRVFHRDGTEAVTIRVGSRSPFTRPAHTATPVA